MADKQFEEWKAYMAVAQDLQGRLLAQVGSMASSLQAINKRQERQEAILALAFREFLEVLGPKEASKQERLARALKNIVSMFDN